MRRSEDGGRDVNQQHDSSLGGCSLPDEILIDIFRLATDNASRHDRVPSSSTWQPFEPAYADPRRDGVAESLRMKHSLTITSARFREIMKPFFYELIWIRHGAAALLATLENSRGLDGLGHGRFVRRVVISAGGHRTPHDLTVKVNTSILNLCPFVEHITRPQETSAGDQLLSDDLNPTFLSRVDWHNTPFDSSFASAPAPRFMFHSKSLRTLVLGADNFPWTENNEPQTVIDLPNLFTLSINSSNSFGTEPRRHTLKMPSLRRLIIGCPEAIYNLFSGTLEHVAPQIKFLELGADLRFLRHDFVATLLSYCPNADTLYIPLATTKPVHVNEVPRIIIEFSSTTTVYLKHASSGLSIAPGAAIRPYGSAGPNFTSALSSRRHSDPKVNPKCIRMWSVLHEHFVGLSSPVSRFVALQKIVLCGQEWKETIEDDRFSRILHLIVEKGLRLACEDREAHLALLKALRASGSTDLAMM